MQNFPCYGHSTENHFTGTDLYGHLTESPVVKALDCKDDIHE